MIASVSRGARAAQFLRERRDQRGGRTRHGADAQLADAAVRERREVGASRFEMPRDRVGVREQLTTRLGQLDRAHARRSRDERHADDALERAQLLADRRLRVAEPHGGATHRALARNRLERRQVPQIEPGPFRKSADDSRSYPEFARARPG